MFDFISSFNSLLDKGRKSALNTLLSSEVNISNFSTPAQINAAISEIKGPLTQLSGSVIDIPGYNSAVAAIYTDLTSIYTESNNLWNYLTAIKSLGQQQAATFLLSVQDLEAKVAQSQNSNIPSTISYTDTVVETFNAQTKVETSPLYYAAGTIPISDIDGNDGLLKLPIDGEFLNELAAPGTIPSNVYLDRIVGLPVSVGYTINNAFDGTITNFWNEVIHAPAPIFCSYNQFPWLPRSGTDSNNNTIGYQGGAACRIKVEFEHVTQVSELDIRPYGQNSMNLLSIGYTNEQVNSLTDPNFSLGLSFTPTPTWYVDTSAFGIPNTGTAVLNPTGGPDGSPSVDLTTFSASGSVFLKHGAFTLSMTQSIEVSFYAKSLSQTPILVGITFSSSGGATLGIKTETVHLDSIGWTKIIISFDPVPGTSSVAFKVGIPSYFINYSTISLSKIFIEPITQHIMYKKLTDRTTVFLPSPVEAKRMYLIFSQENYTFTHYSLPKGQAAQNVSWERLTRRINTSPEILDWDKDINRGADIRTPIISSSSDGISAMLRGVEGTSWQLLQDILSYAYPDTGDNSFPVYEYQMGAFEIYLRHREYAPQSRFVSLPIDIKGEIREVRLAADDSMSANITAPGSIAYTLTLTRNDAPEKGLPLLNSNVFNADIINYPAPPATIPYLDYTTWTYGSSDFQPILWPGQYSNNSLVKDVLLVQIGTKVTPGSYIQKNLSTPLDLRGAAAIAGEFYLFTSSQARVPDEWGFSISFSSDGINWSVSKSINSNFDTYQFSNGQLVTIPFILDLTQFAANLKSSIQYIRVTANAPIYYPWPVYLILRRFTTQGNSAGSRTITFYPADDLPNVVLAANNFVVPVLNKTEVFDGSDRFGCVYLSNYPYINRNTILSTVNSISVNLNGQRVPFDPNTANPKYLTSTGLIGTVPGYRPITVSLYFTNTGQTVLPDILGKPKPGDFGQAINEVLTIANPSVVSQSSLAATILQTGATNITTQSNTVSRLSPVWQTLHTGIVAGTNGVNFTAVWSSGAASGYVAISPAKLKIDSNLGLVQVQQAPPNSSYTSVIATYWYNNLESSSRENFFGASSSGSVFGTSSVIMPQNYPITRNMTDYMTGTIPILTPAVLDPLDPAYYPVYEYYVHPNGYLVFANSLFRYGDIPATVTVNYSTLGISPRICIDMFRPTITSQTPYVDDLTLFLNVRRG
jgi:hypothetical protein